MILKIIFILRKFLWRILGFNYQIMLNKTDYTLLKNDKHTSIGLKTYDNGAKVWRWSNAPLEIGKFCSIAHNVNFIIDEGFHSLSKITNFPLINNLLTENEYFNELKKNEYLLSVKQKSGIIIGHDVWIGMGVYILPGAKVGNGVTIAANSVITKDIPDYCVVAGSPAKIIRKKHSDDIIKKLNQIAWWNWEINIIKQQMKDFYELDIEQFVLKNIK